MSLVGARVLRKEDPKLITGRGRYVDDLHPADTAFMAFVPAPVAHGWIRSIDISEAIGSEGVLGVWTAHDFADHPDLPQGLAGFERPVLARDKVRWYGEPVAVVVAEDRYLAADAVERVVIDIDPLPVVTDVMAAASSDAPLSCSSTTGRT